MTTPEYIAIYLYLLGVAIFWIIEIDEASYRDNWVIVVIVAFTWPISAMIAILSGILQAAMRGKS